MKNNFWHNKTILVTGASGFLGTHLTKLLKKQKPQKLYTPSSKEANLMKTSHIKKVVKNKDIVIHLAATVGGIGFNKKYPATIFYNNAIMGINLIEQARLAKVKKLVLIGTVCSYPKYTKTPFKESDLWNGYPEETNAPYGIAKKILLTQSQAYKSQYKFNSIYLLPTNLYGPNDNFHPQNSHVIPALIKKFIDAKKDNKKSVSVWGTGKPTREFIYVEDTARAIILATEKYNGKEPVNIGSKQEISIKDLANKIKKITKYPGKIIWDTSKPDGQPKRKLNTNNAKKNFNFSSKTSFEIGLKKTIDWYIKTNNLHF